ncbi:MAG: PIN domain-containing protein [Deltaproteobacteria bacterium]|nr:PIN domain-containing protein [Deltaproteobacteria bacterium]
MFRLLVDTCVWLDLAKDPRQAPVVSVIEELVKQGKVVLIVPRIVLDEFRRNRERIGKESAKSLATHFRLVKDAVGRVGDKKKMRSVLSHLDDVNHKIPIIGGAAAATLDRIEELLTSTAAIETSDQVAVRAARRAVEKRAPFHHEKNAMADAILIETYATCVQEKSSSGVRFAFVTHNKSDFSTEHGNQKLPHPEFAKFFSRIKSLYFINLPEALRRIEPSLVSDIMFEQSWTQEPRGLTEILKAEDLLFHQVWYNRHWNLRTAIERGDIRVVDKETFPRSRGSGQETVQRDVWNGALKSAAKVARRYGKKNLGPWDDFEWGMINGKLSALRWALGDEWDMLDT